MLLVTRRDIATSSYKKLLVTRSYGRELLALLLVARSY